MSRMRLFAVSGAMSVAILGLYGCVNMVLPAVPNAINGPDARPQALGTFEDDPAITTAADWTDRRAPLLRAAFQEHLYGAMPAARAPIVEAHTVVDEAAFGGLGRVEQITLRLEGDDERRFNVALAIPNDAEGPLPIILMQTFCGNAAAFHKMDGVDGPLDGVGGCGGGWSDPLVRSVFGRYIAGPPFETVLSRGYAVAIFYAGDVVPDSTSRSAEPLAAMAEPGAMQWGAIGAWAWVYSRTIDYLETDARFDPDRMAVWGHSRNGKSALVAAAFDDRIDAVIAHQSGKGGATLTRSYAGESVQQITDSYPFWFAESYAAFAENEAAIPVDQHQLISLIAPRPILFGNSIRDKDRKSVV